MTRFGDVNWSHALVTASSSTRSHPLDATQEDSDEAQDQGWRCCGKRQVYTRGSLNSESQTCQNTIRAKPITQRDLEIREYAKAMGFFAEQRYEVARPLFLQLAAAGNGDIAHTARMSLRMCEQRLAATSLKDK